MGESERGPTRAQAGPHFAVGERMSSRRQRPEGGSDLFGALLLVTASWSVLLGSGLAIPWLGGGASVLAGFAVAVALAWHLRPTPARSWVPHRLSISIGMGLLGYLSLPALVTWAAWTGLAMGWAPRAVHPPAAFGAWEIAVFVFLAPTFEELVYRERLLTALERHVGSFVSILLSSVCFALPHLEPWGVLATFLVGCLLGALYVATRSLGSCAAFHAGLNLAVLISGLPPTRLALPAVDSAAVILLAAVLVAIGLRRWTPEQGRGSIRRGDATSS